MAYYDAFIAAWNAGGIPANTVGTSITGGMTTAQKLAAVNSWIKTGTIPTTIFISGTQVANCIVWSEFTTLTDAKKSQLLTLLNSPAPLIGGSANTGHLLVGMLLDCFAGGSATIAALTALSMALVQPWWQANNYPRAFDNGDVTAAGLS